MKAEIIPYFVYLVFMPYVSPMYALCFPYVCPMFAFLFIRFLIYSLHQVPVTLPVNDTVSI